MKTYVGYPKLTTGEIFYISLLMNLTGLRKTQIAEAIGTSLSSLSGRLSRKRGFPPNQREAMYKFLTDEMSSIDSPPLNSDGNGHMGKISRIFQTSYSLAEICNRITEEDLLRYEKYAGKLVKRYQR